MKYAVFDTWVDKKNGEKMHFDIVVPENTDFENVLDFGNKYLMEKKQKGQPINTKNCIFCHLELGSEVLVKNIQEKGYHIIEMRGCFA